MDISRFKAAVEAKRDEIIKFMIDLCSIPAVNPSFGGTGEYERAMWLADFLKRHGFPLEIVEVPDPAVKEGKRLNLISVIPGQNQNKTLWLAGHMDTVAAGDPASWDTDPMVPTVKDGKIYGRGVEDNCQAIACMVYSALVMKELGLTPSQNIGLLFVSDEEAGSEKGLKYLAAQGIFKPEDEALVPDAGSSDGSFVEVAEKSILWCKFTIIGKETHASWPQQGINAAWVGTLMAVDIINTLRERFKDRDVLFDPPYSTFELTQRFNNVDSPNVVPGKDVFVMDFRVLPKWSLSQVIDEIDRLVSKYEYQYKVRIKYEFLQRVDAPAPTSPDAPIVKRLVEAIRARGVEPRVGGIGGGTCAAILRELGIPAVVWSTVEELAHEPNEFAVINNIVEDTISFLAIMNG